jgi:SOS-response transcriptional repressor LexA
MGRPETPPKKPSGLYFARKSRGITAAELARKSGQNPQTIGRLEGKAVKGARPMELTPTWAKKFEKALGYSAQEIIFWEERRNSPSGLGNRKGAHKDAPRSAGSIPIVGVAELGAFRQMPLSDDTEDNLPRVTAPHSRLYPNAKHFALEVRGDSMNACKPSPILDGMIALCVDVIDAEIEVESGKIYAVRRTLNGGQTYELTIKRAKVFRNRVELHPESTNPNHQPLIIPIDSDPASINEVTAIGLVYFAGYDFERG